jgi:hypothetical protein
VSAKASLNEDHDKVDLGRALMQLGMHEFCHLLMDDLETRMRRLPLEKKSEVVISTWQNSCLS